MRTEKCPILADDELARHDRDQTAMMPVSMERWYFKPYASARSGRIVIIQLTAQKETRLSIGPEILDTLPAARVLPEHSIEAG